MKKIGLTGSIGSGKSTVSKYIFQKGFIVIDADLIAREVTMPGSPVLSEIAMLFGDAVIESDGTLNRKKLAETAFSNKKNAKILNNTVTKRVIEEIVERLVNFQKSGEISVIFIDAPLLLETDARYLVDEVWVVTSEDRLRAKRVNERDGISLEDFMRRNENQIPQEEKILMADKIIDNSGSLEDLYLQIDNLIDGLIN